MKGKMSKCKDGGRHKWTFVKNKRIKRRHGCLSFSIHHVGWYRCDKCDQYKSGVMDPNAPAGEWPRL